MIQWMVLWIASAVLFLMIDMVWLLGLGRRFYMAEIGDLLASQPNLAAAALFYVLYITVLMIMVIWPAFQAQSALYAVRYGALLGLLAYGTYDLTNLAVMKGFTVRIALIDMVWGMALTAAVSGAAVLIGSRILMR